MKLVLAGCGNMGHAMLTGWLASGIVARADAVVVEPVDALRARAGETGAKAIADIADLPEGFAPDIVVLAVKPQVMAAVAPLYASFAAQGATAVSVAAGTSIASLQSWLGERASVVRVMPNTPAAIGKGMMVACANAHTDDASREAVTRLMAASGDVSWIDAETDMDAVTAVSGSGPAYVFHMIEALAAAARSAGLPDDQAAHLAMQTVYGAAAYAKESGVDPATLRQQVTSPNGTTQAGLEVLMQEPGGLPELMRKTVAAAAKRSRELG